MSTNRRTYKNRFNDFGYHFVVMDEIAPDWVTEHLVHRQVLRNQLRQTLSQTPRIEARIRDELFRDVAEI